MHASVQCKVGVDGSVGRSCDPWNVAPCKLITVLWPLVALCGWTPGSWVVTHAAVPGQDAGRCTPYPLPFALIFCSTCSVYHQSPRCCIGSFRHIYAKYTKVPYCKIYLIKDFIMWSYILVFFTGVKPAKNNSIKVFTSEEWWVMALTLGKKKLDPRG
jgi:hypothetical protein